MSRSRFWAAGFAAAGMAFFALGAAAPLPAAAAGRSVPAQAQSRPQPQEAPPVLNLETQIAELHKKLGITAAQEPQFKAFANVMRENAQTMAHQPPPPANPSAVDALRFAVHAGELELDGMKKLLPPFQALYASLTPAQQKAADAAFRQGPGE